MAVRRDEVVAHLRSWFDQFVSKLGEKSPASDTKVEPSDVIADFLIYVEQQSEEYLAGIQKK